VVVPTKSRAGRRVVGLPKPLVAELQRHRDQQDAERETAANLWRDECWIFSQPIGAPVDPRADYQAWRDLLASAGVRPARLHDARHTAATMLLVLKVPTRAVLDVMGWLHSNMTNRYQHVPTELLTDTAAQVGGLLWTEPPL
jgi:integrase